MVLGCDCLPQQQSLEEDGTAGATDAVEFRQMVLSMFIKQQGRDEGGGGHDARQIKGRGTAVREPHSSASVAPGHGNKSFWGTLRVKKGGG